MHTSNLSKAQKTCDSSGPATLAISVQQCVDKSKKPVTSAYDKQYVCTYLQPFLH